MQRGMRMSGERRTLASRLFTQLAHVLILYSIAAGAQAASVYKCMDAQGHLAYRDTPCAAHVRQSKLNVQPLPTIGDPAEVAARRARPHGTSSRQVSRGARSHQHATHASRRANTQQTTSWECRAADGEVFYRHARCPGSIAGDGTVRSGYAEKMSSRRTRGRQNAWSRVRVQGRKIPRSEACRRIHAAGAAGRDGHLRDDAVSTYDHLMGRDPCDAG